MRTKVPRQWVTVECRDGRLPRLVFGVGATRTGQTTFDTRAEAEAEAARLRRRYARDEEARAAATLERVLDTYLAAQEEKGNRPRTVETERRRIVGFWGRDAGELPKVRSKEEGELLYKRMRERPTQYGEPPSAAEHRACLAAAKRFGDYLVEKKLWRSNPLREVKPIGVAKAGEESKVQLSRDQALMWRSGALAMHADGDQGGLAALVCLMMGRRVTEAAARRVSDLDDGGAALRVLRLKRRGKQVLVTLPILDADLQEALREQAKRARAWGRAQDPALIDPPLFPPIPYDSGGQPVTGEHLSRFSIRRAVHRVCRAVGLPLVCPQALRGTFASRAAARGVAIEAVAADLGNLPQVAARHYASEESQQQGEVHRLRLADEER